MLKVSWVKMLSLPMAIAALLLTFQNCNNTKFGQVSGNLSLSSLSVPLDNKCSAPEVPCQTDRYKGWQVCSDGDTGPVYGVCVFENCRAPFVIQNGICVSPNCAPGETSACTASGNSGARVCEAGFWSACKWIKVTVNGNSAVSLTPENSYVVEVRSSEPNIVVNSSNFTKISGTCQAQNAAPWFLNGVQAKVGLNNFDYKTSVVTSLSGCDWRGQVISNIPGVSSSIVMTALAPQATNSNCVGAFSQCTNGSQTFTITVPQTGTGSACAYANGFTRSCGTSCVGAYGPCVNGIKTYAISTPAANGGMACPVANGSQISCSVTTPVDCVGSFGACANGSHTYTITSPALNGGAACPYVNGATQACGTNCVGAYGACANGTQSYSITTPAANGGMACPVANGATQACGTNCVGAYGACANGTQSYSITTPAANGGMACPVTAGSSRSCGTNCVGAYGTCANGTQSYSITTPAANGGLACPIASGATQSCGTNCVGGYGPCVNGMKTYAITTPAVNGGMACPVAGGSQISCLSTSPVNCAGAFGTCANGTHTYTISTPASNGGTACPYSNNYSEACGTNCVGAYSTCANGSQTYMISTPAANGGASCPVANGATQSCGTNCVGGYGACANGSQTYMISTPAANGGASCPIANGATQSCGTNCVGGYGACANGSQTFIISTPASNGGAACSVAAGTTRSCGTSCVGDWSSCSNGSQTFQISTQPSGGGMACSYSNGQTRSCGNSCVGAWSACSNGSQTYQISTPASAGGASCPVANGATQTCGVACQGSYGACSQTCGGGVMYFNVIVAPSGGGTSCPAASASCNTQACVCTNGAAGSSYPSCTDCASARPGSVYQNGQCVIPCTNGANDPPPFGTCIQCPTNMTYSDGQCRAFRSCSFNGTIIPHNGFVDAFNTSSVRSPGSCVSQHRVCNDGVLSGDPSYTIVRCENLPADVTPVTCTNLSSIQGDMAVSFTNAGGGFFNLSFGTIGDNYWGNGQYDRQMNFYIDDLSQINSMVLNRAKFDDWIWVKVNDQTVFIGPYSNLGITTIERVFYYRYYVVATNIGNQPTELSTSWDQYPNADIRPYLHQGVNTIWTRTIVGGNGESYINMSMGRTCTGANDPAPTPTPTPRNPPSCFVAGTQVSMKDGSTKSIEDIQVGEQILTYDEQNNKYTVSPVEEVLHHETKLSTLYTFSFEASSVTSNDVHLIYLPKEKKYLPAEQIFERWMRGENFELLSKDNKKAEKILSIQKSYKNIPLYNLHVTSPADRKSALGLPIPGETGHNYFVGGVLVHNFKAAP